MKPSAYKYKYSNGHRTEFKDSLHRIDAEITPLYAIDFTKYKLVPIKPTAWQIVQGMDAINRDNMKKINEPARASGIAYKAMIEAVPKIEDL